MRAAPDREQHRIDVERDGSGPGKAVEHPHADRGGATREVEHHERCVGVEEHAENVEHHVESLRRALR